MADEGSSKWSKAIQKQQGREEQSVYFFAQLRGREPDLSLLDELKALAERVEYNPRAKHFHVACVKTRENEISAILSRIHGAMVQQSGGWKVVGTVRDDWPQQMVVQTQGSKDGKRSSDRKMILVSSTDALRELGERQDVEIIWPIKRLYAR